MENTNPDKSRVIMPESATASKSDWSIGNLYSNSWRITKKYKVLWIFGMFALGASSGSSNISNIFDSKSSSPSPSPSPIPTSLPDTSNLLNFKDSPNVLGTTTTTGSENIIWNLFSHINPEIYVLLGIEILAIILLGWIIVIIKNAWATSALLDATEDAIDDKTLTIEGVSQNAMQKIRPMAWIQVVPGLLLLLGSVLILGIPTLIFVFGGNILKIVGVLLFIPAIIVVAIYSVKIFLASIWATRIVVSESISGRQAFNRGIKIQKKKKWAMVGLGLVNTILGGLIFVLPILLVIGLIFTAVALYGIGSIWHPSSVLMISIFVPVAIILFLLLILLFAVGSGVFNAFKTVVWSLAYRKIKGKYDN